VVAKDLFTIKDLAKDFLADYKAYHNSDFARVIGLTKILCTAARWYIVRCSMAAAAS
jgi:hypothetical protein